VTSFVETTQIEPTILGILGLDPGTRRRRDLCPCGCAQPAHIAV